MVINVIQLNVWMRSAALKAPASGALRSTRVI
jgi:hypothetical protein